MAPYIPEVHIEDLPPRAEIPDHLANFLPGVVKHLRDCALAKVQPMIGALRDGDESLQPIHGTQHADHSLVAFGQPCTGFARRFGPLPEATTAISEVGAMCNRMLGPAMRSTWFAVSMNDHPGGID